MNPRLRRIQKLETAKQGKGRTYVVTAPVDCAEELIDEAIASAGLPPPKDQDLVVVLTQFTDDARCSNAVCLG